MTYLLFANACAVQVEDTEPVVSIAYLKDEFAYHCSEKRNELPIVGKVLVKDSVDCPNSAILLHDKRLYADGNILFCKDGAAVVRINLAKKFFILEVDKNTSGGLLALVMQTLLNWYMADYGVSFLHTASFKYNDCVYAIHGFGGAGKTEIMLEALGLGAQYISDDLAIFDAAGRVYPYLRKISLHDYPFTDELLEQLHLNKGLYHLMRRSQARSGRVAQYLYQRYRGRFNVSVSHNVLSATSGGLSVGKGLPVDYNYWLEAGSSTGFKHIDRDEYIKKMSICVANEFRTYVDFDGCYGVTYDFWQGKRESHSKLLSCILDKIDIQGLSIETGHFADCAKLILK